jgi:glycosyltransferase involved in cell wall biosynthesis
MKILITNNHLNTWGGSETWVLTVYNELRQNHEVDVFTLVKGGGVSDIIPTIVPESEYDLILCNHNTCFHVIRHLGPVTYISHGTVPKLEQAPKGARRYISISEEIYLHTLKQYGIKSDIVLNPVDLRFYKSSLQPNRPPKTFLSMCQGVSAQNNVRSFGETISAETERGKRQRILPEEFNRSDLVFSLGRGAYEGLACGRPVIVYDSRDYNGDLYDGLITEENIDTLLKFNCSGRATRRTFSRGTVEMDFSAIQDSVYYRNLAQRFDAEEICKQLIG